jgi:hypothetical protein
MLTASVSPVRGTWVPGVHGTCHHNEIAALLKRSLGPTPESEEASRGAVLWAFRRLRAVAGRYCGLRWDYLETAYSYKGAMRRRYLEAHRSLMLDGPLSSSDYKLRAFVKAEKLRAGAYLKPRMIFPRSPRYNLHLASWLKPFEHWLWGNLKSGALRGVGNSRVVAKGLNPTQRANLIRRKMRSMPDCVVFEVDGKAFEAHVDVWQLLQEHSVYESAYPGDGDLKKALNKQLHNFGRTSAGVKFSRPGGRASGDVNTGMGNSLVMLAVVTGTMRTMGVPWDTLVDGDNALLFVRAHDLPAVLAGFASVALRISGHEMVLERPTSVVEEVVFGQSSPVEGEGGWRMVRDWKKVLSHMTSSHDHLREPRFAREFLFGVALCESVLADRVPILWAACNHLRACADSGAKPRLQALRYYEMLGVDLERVGSWAREPDELSRQSFYRAFGVTPCDQRIIEEECRSAVVRFNCPGAAASPSEYGHVVE